MTTKLKQKLATAYSKDPELVCEKAKAGETLGNDAKYLFEVLGLEKSDLIRLERLGLAVKARYDTQNSKKKTWVKNPDKDSETPILAVPVTGSHRSRWIIFKEALDV